MVKVKDKRPLARTVRNRQIKKILLIYFIYVMSMMRWIIERTFSWNNLLPRLIWCVRCVRYGLVEAHLKP
jgi:hypothetical protein